MDTGILAVNLRNVRCSLLVGASLLVSDACGLPFTGSALAQTVEASDEIVVTARRRDETVQDVPLSVSAFSGAQLEGRGVSTLKDLQHAIPGLQYSDRGNLQTELTIRGVGGDSRNIGIESGVGMYVDGVYVARTSGYNADLTDLERVEVLRGPQGTLFGKNTIGGVINITSRKPTDETEGQVFASYGNFNALRTQASLSGPLSDNLFAKFTVATWDRDGYIHNVYDGRDLNDENRRGGRLQLRWLPTDQLEINVSADVTRDRRHAVLNQMNSTSGAAAPYYTGDRFEANTDQRNEDSRDMWGVSLTADYTLASGHVLTSISAVRDIQILVYSDIDQTPLDLFHSGPFTDNSRMFSQELRLVSPSDGPLTYVAGLYYFRQDSDGIRRVYIGGLLANGAINDAAVLTNSYAGYLNADYKLTDKLTLTGGIRYTQEKKSGEFLQIRPNLNYDFQDMRRKDSNWSWVGSLRYEFNENLTSYVSVSRGYKSGGFNLDTIGAPNLIASDLTFAPEEVTNYELGIKGRSSDDLVRFNLAVFDLEYQDKQVSQFISTGATTIPSNQVTNAGRARIRGFEADATLKPCAGFTLTATAAYLDAKYTRFDSAASIGGVLLSYAGNRIERTPDWTASATAEYRHAMDHGDLVLSGTASYTGDVHLQADNLDRNFENGYLLFDARVGYEMENGFSLSLWGKNLGKKDYRTFARVFAGLDQAVYGEPRTYGIDLRYRF